MKRYAGLLKAQLADNTPNTPEFADEEAPTGELPTGEELTTLQQSAQQQMEAVHTPVETTLQIPQEHVGDVRASPSPLENAMVPEQPQEGNDQEITAMQPQGTQEPVMTPSDTGLILPQVHLG